MRLTYETGEHRGKTLDVGDRPVVVGRGVDADVVLRDDAEVSRRHASLETRPDGTLVLTDLGSTNGTWVNGQRVTGSVALRGGEQVRMGETVLRVAAPHGQTIVGAAPPVPPAEPAAAAAGPPPPLPPHVAGPPPSPPPGTPLPLPPKPASPSMIERIRLRRSVMRANIVALLAAGIAVLAVGGVAILAVAGVFSGDDGSDQPSTAEVVAQATPSTVLIQSFGDGEMTGTGTGWVLDAEKGLIVTNNHVINGGDEFRVGVGEGDERRSAKVLAAAPCEDQALIQVDDTQGLETLALGSQATLKLGTPVVAIGYPANASLRDNLNSTAGVVSTVKTEYRPPDVVDVPILPNVVQTDAAVNPGNSGGPLVTLENRLVGMNTAGFDEIGGRQIQNTNYAIGVDRIKEIAVGQLAQGRSVGWTGLGLEAADPGQLSGQGLPPGMLTTEAAPGSSGDRAGFGDGETRLITEINGRSLDGSLSDYCDAVGSIASGQTATFTVVETPGATPRDVQLELM